MTGCASEPRIQSSEPLQCEVMDLPWLPEIHEEQLKVLDPFTYWALEEREKRIVDWAIYNENTAIKACSIGSTVD